MSRNDTLNRHGSTTQSIICVYSISETKLVLGCFENNRPRAEINSPIARNERHTERCRRRKKKEKKKSREKWTLCVNDRALIELIIHRSENRKDSTLVHTRVLVTIITRNLASHELKSHCQRLIERLRPDLRDKSFLRVLFEG